MYIFNLKLYKPSDLEVWISEKYRANRIYSTGDLTIENVASIFDIEISLYDGPTFAQWEEDGYSFMFFNKYMSEEMRRTMFFHELCHPLRHVGIQDQRLMPQPFQRLQEAQASQFQLFSAMPAYMLEEFTPTYDWSNYIRTLAEAFKLPINFVEQRVQQIMGRIEQERRDRNFKARMAPSAARYGYTDETNRILNQLNHQLEIQRERGLV